MTESDPSLEDHVQGGATQGEMGTLIEFPIVTYREDTAEESHIGRVQESFLKFSQNPFPWQTSPQPLPLGEFHSRLVKLYGALQHFDQEPAISYDLHLKRRGGSTHLKLDKERASSFEDLTSRIQTELISNGILNKDSSVVFHLAGIGTVTVGYKEYARSDLVIASGDLGLELAGRSRRKRYGAAGVVGAVGLAVFGLTYGSIIAATVAASSAGIATLLDKWRVSRKTMYGIEVEWNIEVNEVLPNTTANDISNATVLFHQQLLESLDYNIGQGLIQRAQRYLTSGK